MLFILVRQQSTRQVEPCFRIQQEYSKFGSWIRKYKHQHLLNSLAFHESIDFDKIFNGMKELLLPQCCWRINFSLKAANVLSHHWGRRLYQNMTYLYRGWWCVSHSIKYIFITFIMYSGIGPLVGKARTRVDNFIFLPGEIDIITIGTQRPVPVKGFHQTIVIGIMSQSLILFKLKIL